MPKLSITLLCNSRKKLMAERCCFFLCGSGKQWRAFPHYKTNKFQSITKKTIKNGLFFHLLPWRSCLVMHC